MLNNKPGEKITFDFNRVSLRSAIELLMNLKFDLPVNDTNIHYAEILKEFNISIKFQNYPANIAFSLLLESFDVKVSCRYGEIHFTLAQKPNESTKFFTPHHITLWDGDFDITESGLKGTGTVHYGQSLAFSGEIDKSLLNGSGQYLENGGITLGGEHFKDSILSGPGTLMLNGEILYKGDFLNNSRQDSGRIFFPNYRYNGEFKQDLEDGDGFIEHIVRTESPDTPLRYMYPLDYSTYRVKSSYRGPFFKGRKHGTGNCAVYSEENQSDEFSCEFYYDNLVAINGISLLPEGASHATHLERLSPP